VHIIIMGETYNFTQATVTGTVWVAMPDLAAGENRQLHVTGWVKAK